MSLPCLSLNKRKENTTSTPLTGYKTALTDMQQPNFFHTLLVSPLQPAIIFPLSPKSCTSPSRCLATSPPPPCIYHLSPLTYMSHPSHDLSFHRPELCSSSLHKRDHHVHTSSPFPHTFNLYISSMHDGYTRSVYRIQYTTQSKTDREVFTIRSMICYQQFLQQQHRTWNSTHTRYTSVIATVFVPCLWQCPRDE
jgi:hypothetical protein